MEDITTIAKNLPEFNNHKEIIRLENKDLGVVAFIAIHSRRGSYPSLGATRVWAYSDESEAISDALRLSRLMSHKSIFAGLPYGGAKATIMVPKDKPLDREKLFSWYAKELNNLGGRFVTGSDVGVEEKDVSFMRQQSPFVIGDNVPAAYYTAMGILNSIEVVLEEIYHSPNPSGRTFAIQGLGKTGFELVKLLNDKGGKIIVTDIDPKKIQQIKSEFPQIQTVNPDEIYLQDVDVFSPCAMNYTINALSAPLLRCKAIVGSANNQMESPAVEQLIYQQGILYAVDYIVNNGGIISVADQYENGTHNDDRIKQKLSLIKSKLKNLLAESSTKSISNGVIADNFVASILNT